MKTAILLAMALVTVSSVPLLRHGEATNTQQVGAPQLEQSVGVPAMVAPGDAEFDAGKGQAISPAPKPLKTHAAARLRAAAR